MTLRHRQKSNPQPAASPAPRDTRAQRATPLREGGEGSPLSGGGEVSRASARRGRAALPEEASRPGSIELKRLDQVRAEAARLYNRCQTAWGPHPSAVEARVLCTLLGQIRTLLVDVELEQRIAKLEAAGADTGSTGGAARTAPLQAPTVN